MRTDSGAAWVASTSDSLGQSASGTAPAANAKLVPRLWQCRDGNRWTPARLSGISSHVQPFNDTWNIGSVCLTTALPVFFFFFSAVDHHQETTPYHRSSTSTNAVTKPRPGHALNPLSCIPPPSPAPSSIPITPYSINTNTHYSTPPVPDSSPSQAAPPSLLPIAVLASKA